jgi:transcriptional regulator with XRE-family HTH domain
MFRLTFEREKRNLSRATLARRAKMGAGDVGKIENGRMKPYRSQIVKLGRAMRMRLAEALTLMDEVDPVTGATLDAERIEATFDDPRDAKLEALNALNASSEQFERALNEVKKAGEALDAVRAAAAANGIELAGPIVPPPRCSKCGARLPTPTILQAAERGEAPICDGCFFEQGSEAQGGAHG